MAESYTVLARRYRSQSFDQLVGQEAIAQTLKNAISAGRVAHAFLFTGTRGVGKTSSARILAKALNCPNAKAGEPCNVCDACKAIARGEDIDVIEIDGASNNGVDQVRELRQSAGIRPARSPYKIYIIDEVHMLSLGAFNALLKTLEEPPSHVKFIFATTDVHKVPATIISRVQRFDFKNIPTAKIAEHLKHVCQDEAVDADADAVHRIARLGNGSMRDALSILDRVLSLGEKHITEKLLEDLLGKPPTAAIAELVSAMADSDAAQALKLADALLTEGMGPEQLLGELIEFFRNLMLVAACGDKTDLLDVPTEARPIFIKLAAKFDPPTLVHLIALCEQTLRSLKGTTMARPMIDALLVRLALSEQFTSIRQLLAQPDSAGNVPAAQKKNDISDGISTASVSERRSLAPSVGTPPAQAANSPFDDAAPPEDDHEESIYDAMAATKQRQHDERNAAWAAKTAPSTPPHAAPAESPADAPPEVAEESGSFASQMASQLANTARPTAQRVSGRPGPARPGDAAAPALPVEIVSDVANLAGIWEAAKKYLAANRALSVVNTIGHQARLEAFSTTDATLAVPTSFKNYVGEKIRGRLEEAFRAVTTHPVRLRLSYYEMAPAEAPRAAGQSSAAARVPPEVIEAVRNSPTVRNVLEKLGGDISHIELLDQATE